MKLSASTLPALFLIPCLAVSACILNDGDPDDDDSSGSSPDAGGGVVVTGQRMFVTRSVYQGDFAGVFGADILCQNSADAMTLGGDWTAWLSDNSQHAINRIKGEGPWHSVSGVEIFRNRAALAGSPLVGIREQEDGEDASRFASVWTGTKAGGMSTEPNCSEWTSTEGDGADGKTDSVGGWTQSFQSACISMRHLYCFED